MKRLVGALAVMMMVSSGQGFAQTPITPDQERELAYPQAMSDIQKSEVDALAKKTRDSLQTEINWGAMVAKEVSDHPNCKQLKAQALSLGKSQQLDSRTATAMMELRLVGMRSGCIARPAFVTTPNPAQPKAR